MFKSTYYATKNGQFYKDLPLMFTNICQAAEVYNRLSREFQTSDIEIFERFPVIDNRGDVSHKIYNVTENCRNILWNYDVQGV